MNKKLITLAVAAAMAAPAAAMAEATLYGKLHVSIDYAEVDNAIAPEFFSIALPSASSGLWTPVPGSSDMLEWTGPNGFTYEISAEDAGAANAEGLLFNNVVVVDQNGIPVTGVPGENFNGWGVNGNSWKNFTGQTASPLDTIPQAQGRANRIGVKGSEDLGNGLKAIYQVEFGVNFSSQDNNIPSGNNGGVSIRNSFVGLAGNWGTFLVGRHDTPLKISTGKLDLFADTMADYNGTVGFQDLRVDNAIAYISPSFGGFSLAGALVAPGGATDGYGLNINSDGINGAWSVAGIYNNGPFYASAAWEVLSNEMFMNSAVSEAGRVPCYANNLPLLNCNYVADDYSKWRLGLGLLDWNGFTLTAIYEQQDDLPGGQQSIAVATVNPDGTVDVFGQNGVKEQRLWQVQAAYSFGNNTIKAMYGAVDRDADRPFDNTRRTIAINSVRDDLSGDRETWAVGFDHNFSKRSKIYALYTEVRDDQDGLPGVEGAQWSGFSLGMIHSF